MVECLFTVWKKINYNHYGCAAQLPEAALILQCNIRVKQMFPLAEAGNSQQGLAHKRSFHTAALQLD